MTNQSEIEQLITTEINRVTGVEVLPIYNNPTAAFYVTKNITSNTQK